MYISIPFFLFPPIFFSLSLLIGINEYCANPNIIGDGNHTLKVRCYYSPGSLSVSEQYDFKLDPAPEICK